MSFWDRVEAAASELKDSAESTLGHAFSVATGSGSLEEATQVAGALSSVIRGDKAYDFVNQKVLGREDASLFNDLGKPLDLVQRASSAYIRHNEMTGGSVVDKALPFGGTSFFRNFTDVDGWRKAWDAAGEASPGQTFLTAEGAVPQGVTLASDPASRQKRDDYFQNTWQGKYSSGTLDFVQNLVADPLVIGGKVAKGVREAESVVKAADASKVLDAVRTGDKVGGRIGRQADKFTQLLHLTDSMSAGEMAALPQFKAAGDASGALAYFFERANKSFAGDTAEALQGRHAVKRDLLGAILGDEQSIGRLKVKEEMLAHEVKRTLDTPPQSRFAEKFTWDDGGQGAFALFQEPAEQVPELRQHADAIAGELDRLSRVLSARSGKLGFTAGEIQKFGKSTRNATRDVVASTIHSGLAARPIRVIQAAAANRLPGHVNVADPVSGFEQLQGYLGAANRLSGDLKRRLLDDYVKGATQGDRQGVVRQAEALVEQSVARHYNLKPDEYEALKRAAQGRRNAWLGTLKDRLYSAAPDAKTIHVHDPETDELIVYPTPLLRSQIEDQLPVVDPAVLDKTIKAMSKNRLLEDVAGTHLLDSMSEAHRHISDALMWGTRVWKDSMLFRLAYPIRVQVDTQMRLMAYMGSLGYLKSIPGMAEDFFVARYSKNVQTGIDRALNQATARLSAQVRRDVGDDFEIPEEMRGVIARMVQAEGGSQADLASEMSRSLLNGARSTGQWGIIDPRAADDADWTRAYVRAVNQQIRNSPAAMAMLKGADKATVARLARTDPAVRKEWLELKGSNDNDLEAWLDRVEAHVDHYLPESEIRDVAVQRGVDIKDVGRLFPVEAENRMVIHGESYSPLKPDSLGQKYQKVRESFYKWASDAPETVLGRSPIYAFAYRKGLKDIVSRYPGETLTTKEIRAAQIQADRFARREVARVLFDSSHTSNLASHFRHIAPFFGAWEDMMKKWGALMYEKPWIPVRLEQAWNAPNNAGLVVDSMGNRIDAEGRAFDAKTGQRVTDKSLLGDGEYFVLPTGILKGVTGQSEVKIRKDSFNITFQGEPWWLPGMGPMVQVPANQIVRKSFPDLADSTVGKYIFPYGLNDTSTGNQVLPSWIRQAKNAFGNTTDYQNTYSLLLAQETSRWAAGERPDKPTADEIAKKARNWFILRAITANASPVSMQPSAALQFYVDQAHIYRSKYGEEWQTKFDEDFPDYYRMRLSLTANETGIVATERAYKAASDPKNRKLIAQHPEFGFMVVGPDNAYGSGDQAFSQGVYTWEQTQRIGYGTTKTFRSRRDNPNEALKEVEISRGWGEYVKARTALNVELERRGIKSLASKEATPLREAWNAYVQQLKDYNPSWREQFGKTDSQKAARMLTFGAEMIKQNPRLASRGDMQALDAYARARVEMQKLMKQRGIKTLPNSDTVAVNPQANNADLRIMWDSYMQQLVQWNIGFEQMYTRGLSADDLSEQIDWPGIGGN